MTRSPTQSLRNHLMLDHRIVERSNVEKLIFEDREFIFTRVIKNTGNQAS